MSLVITPRQSAVLSRSLAQVCQPIPAGLRPLRLGPAVIGHVHPMRDALLARCWPELRLQDGAWIWPAADQDMATRSRQIGEAAQRLRELGAVSGWRDERFTAEAPVDDPSQQRGEPLFHLERAAFRFFGLMSRAVHINGFLPGGRLLCGRRALTKATDPGRLDNLAAGGLGAEEDLIACARRELMEEAGVPMALSATLRPRGALMSRRMEPEGLHHEVLHVFSLLLPAGFVARNGDGEVSEFLTLDLESVCARIAAGEFSHDAAAVCAWGLTQANALTDLRP